MREGHCGRNPALDVRAPKSKKRLPATLDADQMGRLLAFRVDDSLSARDKAIMELFYSSGLRLSELVDLKLTGIDLKDRTVRVLGKGSKTRIVPVGRQAVEALEKWLQVRAGLVKAGQALFVGRSGRPLSVRAVQLRVGAWGRRQGIGIHIHPHLFRHSFAPICSSPAATCAACRNCWVMPISGPPRYTPTSISSIWRRCTIPPIRAPGAAGAALETAGNGPTLPRL